MDQIHIYPRNDRGRSWTVALDVSPSRAPIAGAVWMVAAGLAFAGVNTLEQIVTTRAGLSAPTAAFFQYFVALLVVLPWAGRQGLAALRTRHPGLQVVRVVFAALGVQAWVAGLAHAVPIGAAVALVMTSPFFVTLGAGLVLGERVTAARWIAVTVGFIGALVILDPFSGLFTPASLLPLAASLLWAAASLCQKRMLSDESPQTNAAWLLFLLAPVNLALAIPSGITLPVGVPLVMIVAVGIFTALAQGFLALAYSRADAAYVQPFDHVKLPLNIIASWLVFGWLPPGTLWLGALLIVGASLFLMVHETRQG
jgi:drug/metabolite transporter (DMT)-like permease